MSVIVGIATAVPQHKSPQTQLANFMNAAHNFKGDEERKLRFLYARSGIETRYSTVPDYLGDEKNRELFTKTNDL